MLSTRLKAACPLILLTLLAFFLNGWGGVVVFSFFVALMLWVAVQETKSLLGFSDETWLGWLGFSYGIIVLFHVLSLYIPALSPELQARPMIQLGGCFISELIVTLLYLLVLLIKCFRRSVDDKNLKLLLSGIFIAFLCQALMFMPRLYFLPCSYSFLEDEAAKQFSSICFRGSYTLFFMVLVTKMADVGAYALGSYTSKRPGGNHKIAPRVSPGKSWEGLLGGIIFSLISAVIVKVTGGHNLFFSLPFISPVPVLLDWVDVIAMGICLPVVGLIGDLMESLLKRVAGAKDSGTIPGLGGALDILDSLTLCAPFFYLWMAVRIFAKVL